MKQYLHEDLYKHISILNVQDNKNLNMMNKNQRIPDGHRKTCKIGILRIYKKGEIFVKQGKQKFHISQDITAEITVFAIIAIDVSCVKLALGDTQKFKNQLCLKYTQNFNKIIHIFVLVTDLSKMCVNVRDIYKYSWLRCMSIMCCLQQFVTI